MNLRSYRKSRGLSQKQVAEALGIEAESMISMIERERRKPTLRLALKIQRWSNGEVKAAELCPDAADLVDQLGEGAAP
jgi:transcriptional regulator with XRE-family HTH domain